jgi:hypothetical protein
MHLSGETQASDVIAPQSGTVQNARNGNRTSSPPFIRMLLCPANLRRRKRRVLFRGGRNHAPVLVHDQGARSASSDVNAEYVDKLSPSPYFQRCPKMLRISTPSNGSVRQPLKSTEKALRFCPG